MEKINQVALGERLRFLREKKELPLRKVAAALDIDPSTLSKIERGERSATKEMIVVFARVLEVSETELNMIFLSDKVASELLYEDNPNEILKVAEEKIRYMKSKKISQGNLSL